MNQDPPRKVGVLTFHRCINYGSYWQARCLVEAIRAAGHDAVLLDHDTPGIRRKEWRCALQPRNPLREQPGDMEEYAQKTRLFLKAIEALPLSQPFASNDPASAETFDAIVVGSDEVWNFYHPWYGGYRVFYGEGLRTSRLISYAASFGNYSTARGLGSPWAGLLSGFTEISVRDHNSMQIISDTLGTQPALVLDPCLLSPPAVAEPETATPYIAVYGHSFPRWYAYAVRDFAASKGHRLVSIGYRNEWADEQRIAVSPERFASLMAGAAAVATNFFHGCVFAILNNKPFASVSSDYRANKLRDLMNLLGTQQHLVDEANAANFSHLLATPLDNQLDQRLGELRTRSRAYLERALQP